MPGVADVIRQHAPAYLKQFGDRVPSGHRRVINAIARCRTGDLGAVLYQCDGCGRRHWVGRSCGNRHCPGCQKHKTAQWLAKQTQRLLPVQHFLVTFTVSDQLRCLLRAHQRTGYETLFAAGSGTIRKLLANDRYLGTGNVGFFGVLHTWGRDPLVYHPHVHFVVPGGGVSQDGTKWLSTPENFLFPHARAIALYKKLFADRLRRAGLYDQVPAEAWHGKWVVDIRPVGSGQAVLKYLAPYVYRVAISDNRILACDQQSVTFGYRPSGKKRSKIRSVSGREFVRGFVQHTLPRGFQKVRYYGWMSPNCKIGIDAVRWLVWLYLSWVYHLVSGHPPKQKEPAIQPRCAQCGSAMRIVAHLRVSVRVFPLHAVPYLDSS